ncbi:family 16 glycosylhydrolase [Ruania halotolerans]|uniref:family 16 glycosylhydrolase n=1 Tax=Ruania halotolerans TaxID=2897773 RepID=UPI001E65D4EE|nr:family 16 glycosylhydrolase [Ruania halotolerans]UFU04873.1 family 16 glycosylhydrolase [Ruania halotolerans]
MTEMRAIVPDPPTADADLDEDFPRVGLRPEVWVDHYLPQWTTPDRSRARWDLDEQGVRLRIDDDQPDWRPEDAPLRVSNLQTATFAGPVGSHRGTHRHRQDGLTVRTAVPTSMRWAPSGGRVDVTVTASTDSGCMTAIWLVGTEHLSPHQSGEVCVAEIDAEAIGPVQTRVRSGLKAHHDPHLRTDMAELTVPVDASRPHTWTAIWGTDAVVIGCEGRIVRRLDQTPHYPMVLMIDLFEIGGPTLGGYPKTARVHRVRGWGEQGVDS